MASRSWSEWPRNWPMPKKHNSTTNTTGTSTAARRAYMCIFYAHLCVCIYIYIYVQYACEYIYIYVYIYIVYVLHDCSTSMYIMNHVPCIICSQCVCSNNCNIRVICIYSKKKSCAYHIEHRGMNRKDRNKNLLVLLQCAKGVSSIHSCTWTSNL